MERADFPQDLEGPRKGWGQSAGASLHPAIAASIHTLRGMKQTTQVGIFFPQQEILTGKKKKKKKEV